MPPKPKRILFATIGSLGDLHPCLAMGQELQRRGHLVTIAATDFYREKAELSGLSFRSMRPNWNPTDHELIRQCEDLRTGPEILYRKLILPHLSDTYQDLLSACGDTDLLVAGELVYAAPLVAERLRLPWASMILSPSSFFSSYDPSILVTVPALVHLRRLGRPIYRAGVNLCRLATRHWSNPVRRLRREHGLRKDCDPVFRDKYSEDLVMALFSPQLGRQQPDWPLQTIQPGFVFHDHEKQDSGLSPELARFLAEGDPPLVFTLGSTAVHHPANFYEVSEAAARRLNRRAVLVGASISSGNSSEILAVPYAPYSQVFPRAAAVVHQGGSGTTGQVMRAGRPMLVVPYGWDQPDNAARIERLGVGLTLSRRKYSLESATAKIQRLLTEPGFEVRAQDVALQLNRENGLSAACDALQSILLRRTHA